MELAAGNGAEDAHQSQCDELQDNAIVEVNVLGLIPSLNTTNITSQNYTLKTTART